MATAHLDQYFSYDARLSSFQKGTKKRASTTTASARAAKTLNWPHKQISPASLAKAGFFFRPSPASPDNTVCFLCEKGLDGWEAGDDPLLEHLKHAPYCGWAVVAAIEAELGDYGKEDPNKPEMVEARKATFAGKWPHDGKKGWKCKTKQLVEAGWKYTPVTDSDDMATCTYCQLALDGWEPNDKPFDEHYNRSPDCPFFTLTNHYKTMGKNSGRGKAARTSKASRLSCQSVGTVASETTDLTTAPEDSVLTTVSTTTQQVAKKARAKKGTTAKGSKKKIKKEEPSEIHEDSHQAEEESLPLPPPKAKRSRKRTNDAFDESTMSTSEGPAPKKRANRTPATEGADGSIVVPEDNAEMTEAPAKATGRKKAQASNTKSDRKAPAALDTNASMASLRGPPGSFPDDDEIERRLEADLERQSSDDEEIAYGSDSGRLKARAKQAAAATAPEVEQAPPVEERSADYAMFDPTAPEPDESAIDEELKALQAEMEVDEPEQQLHVPKKGRKAGTGKVSKQTKANKLKAESPPPEEEPEPAVPEPQTEEGIDEDVQDVSVDSTDTVVKKKVPAPTATGKRGRGRPSKASLAAQDEVKVLEAVEPAQPKRGRGRPSKASLASQASNEAEHIKSAEAPAKRGRGRPSKASLASQELNPTEGDNAAPAPVKRGRGRPSKASLASQDLSSLDSVNDTKDTEAPAKRGPGRPSKKSIDIKPTEQMEIDVEEDMIKVHQPSEEAQEEPKSPPTPPIPASQSLRLPPSTPTKVISPAPSARQPVLSPSQSPQSSDAENQPPSTRPPVPATIKRVVLAPVSSTPMRGSPSKRNVMAGLRSATPWTATNLEAIFGTPRSSPCKQNEADRFLKRGKELTSPEKQMTVEEWIRFNAAEAEKKLKHECEALVNRFEGEGTRAIQVLEGLEVE